MRVFDAEAHDQLLHAGGMLPEQCDALRHARGVAVSIATSCQPYVAVVMVDGLAPSSVALKSSRVTHACYVRILEYSPPTIYPGQDSAHGGHTGTFLKRYVQKVKILTAPRNSIAHRGARQLCRHHATWNDNN